MKRISILLSGLFIALIIFSSCSATQEKEDRTNQVDEPIYVQDSTAAVELSDSIDGMDTLSELEMMELERAQEKLDMTNAPEADVDILEGDDQ